MPPLLDVRRMESGDESESAARKDVGSGGHESCMKSLVSTRILRQIRISLTHPIRPVVRANERQQQFFIRDFGAPRDLQQC